MTRVFRRPISLVRRLGLVATVALAAMAAEPTRAQFGGQAGLADAFRPDFLARDMNLFVETLTIEEWQRPILETLLQDYQDSFNAGVDQVRQRMAAMKDQVANASPERVMSLILAPIDQWSREKSVLRDRFLEDVRSQLSPAQQENWPRFERAYRREKYLDQGEISGESVNLLLVLKQLQFAPQVMSAVRPAIDEYEWRLDEALQTRQSQIERVKDDVTAAMAANDFNAGLRAMEQIMAARVGVRAAQDEAIESISAALGEFGEADASEEFRATALARAYPKVYREEPIGPVFARALAIPDLSADQREALTSLQAAYGLELDAVNLRFVQVLRVEEPREPKRRIDMMKARERGETVVGSRETEAVAAIRREREDLFDRTRQAIFAILNPEQQAQLPGFGKTEATGANVAGKVPILPRGAEETDPLGTSGDPTPKPVRKEAASDLREKDLNRRRAEPSAAGPGRTAPPPAQAAD